MVEINQRVNIEENELEFSFIRADGPGGQNINKVSTAVQLRFDVMHSTSLPEEVKPRLIKLAGNRVTHNGILIIVAKRYRSQDRNREDALERFRNLVRKAFEKPKKRVKTKPSKAAQEERLKEKKRKSEIKRLRRSRSFDQE